MSGAGPVLRSLAGAAMALALMAPLLPLTVWSFARGWRFPDLLPQEWTLQAWRHALSGSSGVLESLGVSLFIAACTAALSVAAAIPAGRALGLYQFRGKPLVMLLMLAPTIVPGLAAGFGLQQVFLAFGLTGSLGGVILVHLIPALPYAVLVLAAVFAGFDPAFEQQARSLGAGPAQVFAHVTWPAIRPGVLVAALFAFLVSWSQYSLTLIIGGGQVVTLPLLLFSFAASGRHDLAGAIGIVSVLPGALILIFSARSLTGRSPAAGGLGPI